MAERWNAAQNEAPRTRHLTYEGDDRSGDHKGIRATIVVLVAIACLLVVLLVGSIALSSSPMFTIASIDAEDTEHLSAENIAKLANVEEGTTLLTFDSATITENLKRNPWVGTVSFTREFPDRLKIEVTERRVDCVEHRVGLLVPGGGRRLDRTRQPHGGRRTVCGRRRPRAGTEDGRPAHHRRPHLAQPNGG